jgi:hypothetical protein
VFHFVDNHWFWFSDTSQSVNRQFQFFEGKKTKSKALVQGSSKTLTQTWWFCSGNLQDLSTQKRKNCELHAFLSLWTWSFLSCTKSALGFGGIGTF